jgi:hypothetical protein
MIMTKLFKTFLFIAAISLSTISYSQGNSTMQRGDNDRRATAEKEAPTMYTYSIVELVGSKGDFQIDFVEGTNASSERAMKDSRRMMEKMKSQTEVFVTEVDVLNYLAQMGMEVVSIVPDMETRGKKKRIYLRKAVERR